MAKFENHDEYVAAAPTQFQPTLTHLRGLLTAALPDAREVIAYDLPGFQVGDVMLVGYAAFTKQCGIYVSHGAIAALKDDIEAAGLKSTKMGVTFSDKKPIPDALVTQLALACRTDYGV